MGVKAQKPAKDPKTESKKQIKYPQELTGLIFEQTHIHPPNLASWSAFSLAVHFVWWKDMFIVMDSSITSSMRSARYHGGLKDLEAHQIMQVESPSTKRR